MTNPTVNVANSLRGVWAAIPVPWLDDEVDPGLVRELLRRYSAAGVQGAYTAGTDGEMHVLEESDSSTLTSAIAAGSAETGMPVQAGCTWHHTKGVVRRIRTAADAGVPIAQLALPQWVPLSDVEVLRFFESLSAQAPQIALVHYNHAGTGRFLGAANYRSILEVAPNLVGSKQTGGDVAALSELVQGTPDLCHFVVDHQIVPSALMGARGFYSFHANLIPHVVMGMWRACEQGDWPAALRHRVAIESFLQEWRATRPALGSPALAKIATRAGIFEDMPLDVRGPYSAGTQADVIALKALVDKHFPDGRFEDPGVAGPS